MEERDSVNKSLERVRMELVSPPPSDPRSGAGHSSPTTQHSSMAYSEGGCRLGSEHDRPLPLAPLPTQNDAGLRV